ncbi:MAG TPA: hypothetical protein VMW17_10115 [Candidatus Binatia bacterium]|nr:hypothetical protein [Candidatus Binatia bacterium]
MQISYQDVATDPTTLRIPVSNMMKTALISLALWSGLIWAAWMVL